MRQYGRGFIAGFSTNSKSESALLVETTLPRTTYKIAPFLDALAWTSTAPLVFREGLEIGEAFCEFAANHLVHVEDRAHHFVKISVATGHDPRHSGRAPGRDNRKLDNVVGGARLNELELHRYPGRRGCFGNLNAPFA